MKAVGRWIVGFLVISGGLAVLGIILYSAGSVASPWMFPGQTETFDNVMRGFMVLGSIMIVFLIGLAFFYIVENLGNKIFGYKDKTDQTETEKIE